MKNLKLSLFVALLLVGFVMNLEAAYIVKRTSIFTARVNVTGFTNTALNASIFTRIGDVPDSMVTWTNCSLPITGLTKWKVGNHYVKVTYTNYVAPWGLAFYTANTNTTIAKPRFTGSPDVAGVLVSSNTPNMGLSLAWQIQQTITEPSVISDPVAGAFTNTGWSWKYMSDKASSAFTNRSANAGTVGTSSANYYSIPLYNGQRLWGSAAAERGATSSPVFIYLAADFTTAMRSVYKTTALTVEMFNP